ncbi:MAG: pseudouridine synthase [Thaumarchaeota archaeon]|jgi:uncharacterized protein with predicted RNA binding PUA domain|nr:pseudouridine synthase [Nitrososphaerota archaeon]
MEGSKFLDRLLLRIVRDIADYQFGRGTGEKLFPDECVVEVSKRTGRPRYIKLGEEILATIRYPDNMIALSLRGAERLREALGDKAPRIVLRESGVERVLRGMNPLAADIQYCSDGIRPGEEVLVESSDGRLIAIGKAITSSRIVRELKTGAVIKIRKVKKR